MRAKLKNSLTTKIFFITCLLLMLISVLTYGGISLMMPATYAADQMAALTAQSQQLAVQLEALSLETCGPLLSQFTATYDAQVILLDPNGAIALEAGNQMWQTPEAQAESASQVHWLLTAEDPADFSSDLEPPPSRPLSTAFPSPLLLMYTSSWSSAAPRQSTRPWQLWGGSGHGCSGPFW